MHCNRQYTKQHKETKIFYAFLRRLIWIVNDNKYGLCTACDTPWILSERWRIAIRLKAGFCLVVWWVLQLMFCLAAQAVLAWQVEHCVSQKIKKATGTLCPLVGWLCGGTKVHGPLWVLMGWICGVAKVHGPLWVGDGLVVLSCFPPTGTMQKLYGANFVITLGLGA